MGQGNYGVDAWLWPIVIDSTNNTFQIEEDSGSCVITVTLTAGTYYLHDDTSLHATYKGLFVALDTLLGSSTGSYADGSVAVTGTKTNSYSFSIINPTSSTSVTNAGLRLNGNNGVLADDWIIDVSDSTLDMRHLGQLTAAPTDPASAGAGTDKYVDSPGCMLGRWLPYNHAGAPAKASRKRPIPYKLGNASTEHPEHSQWSEWYSGTARVMEYRWQMSPHIHQTRADETGYASQGGVAAGDKNNAFFHVWDALTARDEVIVVHNSTSDLQVDANDYEVVKAWRGIDDWENVVTAVSDPADLYLVSVPVAVLSGNYAH